MTLTAEQQAEIDRQVAARLAAAQPQGNGATMQPAGQMQGWGPQQGWGAPAASNGGVPVPGKVLVPVEITGPDGSKVTLYFEYGPEHASPQALMNLVGGLINSGAPVKSWAPKQRGWGGGGGSGYGGNGNGNGGGYGGGGRRW